MQEIASYLGRISQPLLDRLDLCVETPQVEYEQLVCRGGDGPSSQELREGVLRAVERQKKRYQNTPFSFNSQLPPSAIGEYCPLDENGQMLMEQAFHKLNLSARAYHRIIKVARTIADLEESEQISPVHLAEAIGYRSVDKKYWS